MLEIWVSGDESGEVTIALHGLAQVATLHYVSPERKLGHGKKSRIQRFVRAVPAARRAETKPPRGKEKTFDDEPLAWEES